MVPRKAAPALTKASAADVGEHNATHMPYRSWRGSCVEGRGLGEQRGRHAGRVHKTQRVGIDYWYITTGSLKLRKELADEYPSMQTGTPRYRQRARSERL